jgi:hypothetical protein
MNGSECCKHLDVVLLVPLRAAVATLQVPIASAKTDLGAYLSAALMNDMLDQAMLSLEEE